MLSGLVTNARLGERARISDCTLGCPKHLIARFELRHVLTHGFYHACAIDPETRVFAYAIR